MHPEKTNFILRKLSVAADGLIANLPDGHKGSYRSIPEYWDEQFLIGEALKEYELILEDLLNKQKWGEKFSEKSVLTVRSK